MMNKVIIAVSIVAIGVLAFGGHRFYEHKYTTTNKGHFVVEAQKQSTTEAKNDAIEIIERFVIQNNENEFSGKEHNVNISNKEFTMLSAYVLSDNFTSSLFYRIKNNKEWTDWNYLPQDSEVRNPNRVVFKGPYIFSNIDIIQFKSTRKIDKEIVFRLFIADKIQN